MGKDILVIIFGAWVAIQSFLGLPLFWDTIVYVILGLCIVGLGVLLRRDSLHRRENETRQSETFAENAPSVEKLDQTNSGEVHENSNL